MLQFRFDNHITEQPSADEDLQILHRLGRMTVTIALAQNLFRVDIVSCQRAFGKMNLAVSLLSTVVLLGLLSRRWTNFDVS